VRRGDAVVGPDAAVAATTVLDTRLTLRGGAHNQRVHVHHGTRDVPARIVDLADGYWQVRLEAPILAADGDKLVVRSIAPPDTLGGGTVLNADARRHGRAQAHRERLATDRARARASIPAVALTPKARATVPLGDAAQRVAQRLLAAGHEPPSAVELGDDAVELPALRAAGLAQRVGRDCYAHPEAIAAVHARLEALSERDGSITLGRLRDELSTSRKFAQALLEYFDAARITLRLPDDSRILRRR
jgi:selenocysteine-specific elongation factor